VSHTPYEWSEEWLRRGSDRELNGVGSNLSASPLVTPKKDTTEMMVKGYSDQLRAVHPRKRNAREKVETGCL
jgi:hypothetical protein